MFNQEGFDQWKDALLAKKWQKAMEYVTQLPEQREIDEILQNIDKAGLLEAANQRLEEEKEERGLFLFDEYKNQKDNPCREYADFKSLLYQFKQEVTNSGTLPATLQKKLGKLGFWKRTESNFDLSILNDVKAPLVS